MQKQLNKPKCLEKNNQRSTPWKLRKGEQSFLFAICCPNPIHIPEKLHEDIPVTGLWPKQENKNVRKELNKGG